MAIAYPAQAAGQAPARSERAPGSAAVGGLVAISLAVGVVDLYLLWKFWPTQEILKTAGATGVNVFGIHFAVAPEVRLLVVIALAGALGGLMHSTRSLAWYVGHGALVWRWIPYYLATIVIGAGLASIFYLIVRGGVFGGNAATGNTNPYGFAAIGALVGLFTEQALEMLRRVANQVFAVPPQGADSVASSTITTDTSNTTDTTTDTTTDAPSLAAVTGTASNLAATSATLEGDVTSGSVQTSYHFDYGTTTGYGQITSTQTVDDTAPQVHVTTDVNGLTPGAEYHYRLVVADITGAWTTGADATFTTPAG